MDKMPIEYINGSVCFADVGIPTRPEKAERRIKALRRLFKQREKRNGR